MSPCVSCRPVSERWMLHRSAISAHPNPTTVFASVRIAVLAHQQDVSISRQRDDSDRARMADVLARGLFAVGQAHDVAVHVQEASGVDLLAGDEVLGEVFPLQGATGS